MTSVTPTRKRALLIAVSLLASFVLLRAWLWLYPATNLDLLGYNIHHLFTGVLLLTLGAIPLCLFAGNSPALTLACLLFGAGLGMVLDEWVYLIVTDGSDGAYLLPVSFWGGAALVALVLAYIAVLLKR
jgi:hypothetical protein